MDGLVAWRRPHLSYTSGWSIHWVRWEPSRNPRPLQAPPRAGPEVGGQVRFVACPDQEGGPDSSSDPSFGSSRRASTGSANHRRDWIQETGQGRHVPPPNPAWAHPSRSARTAFQEWHRPRRDPHKGQNENPRTEFQKRGQSHARLSSRQTLFTIGPDQGRNLLCP